jgi:hypothetical protein
VNEQGIDHGAAGRTARTNDHLGGPELRPTAAWLSGHWRASQTRLEPTELTLCPGNMAVSKLSERGPARSMSRENPAEAHRPKVLESRWSHHELCPCASVLGFLRVMRQVVREDVTAFAGRGSSRNAGAFSVSARPEGWRQCPEWQPYGNHVRFDVGGPLIVSAWRPPERTV